MRKSAKPPEISNHDTAARLLGIAPVELAVLLKASERAPKQADIAEHLDLSDRSVREFLTAAGMDHRAVTLSEIRVAYIRHLREIAAGRAALGDIDLATERALLARAQREGQAIKNAVAVGAYAPIELLSDVLANAAQSVVDRLEQIPADLRRACPDLPQAARDAVMAEIASARNEMTRKTVSLVVDAIDPADMLQDDVEGTEADAVVEEDGR